MIILFVDGTRMKINEAAALKLKELIISKDGAKVWQAFMEESTNKFLYMINLTHVVAIAEEENFIPWK